VLFNVAQFSLNFRIVTKKVVKENLKSLLRAFSGALGLLSVSSFEILLLQIATIRALIPALFVLRSQAADASNSLTSPAISWAFACIMSMSGA
jgi:hypothetical protein